MQVSKISKPNSNVAKLSFNIHCKEKAGQFTRDHLSIYKNSGIDITIFISHAGPLLTLDTLYVFLLANRANNKT